MCRYRQRRLSASDSSRVLFDVSTTYGRVTAATVPSSGIVTWKSDRTSSSRASNSQSTLSISATRSHTGGLEQRPGQQEVGPEDVVVGLVPAAARVGLDAQQLLGVIPLVQGLGLVESLVALQANQPRVEHFSQRLGELGLAHPRRPLDQNR